MLIRISISANIFETLTYRFNGDADLLNVGQRVVVPLVNRLVTGWVIEKDVQYKGRVKSITGILSLTS